MSGNPNAPRRRFTPGFARLGVLGLFVVLGVIYWHVRAPVGYDIALAGGPYPVGGKEVTRVVWAPIVGKKVDPQQASELSLESVGADAATTTRVRLPAAGDVAIDISVQNGPAVHRNVHVQRVAWLAWAAVLFLVIALLIPYALATGSSVTATNVGGPWYGLLSEAGGGYSLARVQLLIWFLPTAVLYAALSFTLQGFADITAEIAILIGLSGATTMLGTAASPSKAAAAPNRAEPVAPDLGDLVTDWNAHGDLSRYQYLLLSIVGAVVMVAAFWRGLEFPSIPSQLLYLIAGSQGTYLATKAIKTSKIAEADTAAAGSAPAPASPVPAPSTMSPAPADTAPVTGSFQLVGK